MDEPKAPGTTRDRSRAGETFPRGARLRRRSDYLRTYSEGRKVFGKLVVVFARENETGQTRLGITAPKRVGSAVVRNLMRRRIREIARRMGRGPVCRDVVVNVRETAPAARFSELKAEVEALLRRTGARA